MKAGNSRVLQTITLVLIVILFSLTAYGKVIYVDDDAAGLNDGTSWGNAYVYLQDALADANIADKPAEIWVAQGVYRPDSGIMAIPEFDWRTMTFQLIDGVALKGGYAGIGEPDPDARDIVRFETVLSGDLSGDDTELADPFYLCDEPTRSENSYHVVTGGGTNATAVLDGFTVSDGNANGPRLGLFPDYDYTLRCGAGIYNISGNPMVSNCTFIRNSARNDGGAMYNEQSSLNLINCMFSGNSAHTGGGIRNVYNSNPKVTDCTFSRNSTRSGGGGMANYQSNPLVVNCTFNENNAFHYSQQVGGGGGGMDNRESNPILTNCRFSGNSAQWGGGMANGSRSSPTLTNCTFGGNLANAGAGISNFVGSGPVLINCTFSGNSASLWGGGMDSRDDSGPTLINCTFSGNSARNGNALAYNFMPQDKPSNVELIDCIVWDGGDEIWNNDGSTINMTYSDIQGGQASVFDPCEAIVWGKGNIDADPLFVEPGYWAHIEDANVVVEPNDPNAVWVDGDYHLKSQAGRWDPNSESWVMDEVTSPCIDAGDSNSPVGDEPEPNGGRINMGAYGGTAEASKSGDVWWFETTQGPIAAEGLGVILPHEHIFTDLRGPGTRGYGQADAADVVRVMAPLLEEAKQKGVGLLFECSSIGVGRNVSILSEVSAGAGLPVVVPTGVYGRANFAPVEHRNMSEDELTELFISEIREGIEGTGIKAGFIKIATGGSAMNALEEKILRVAGRAAKETGAAVASHTTVGSNATKQADILESISPEIRFIWVHAQSANNRSLYQQLAERGVFIEFDSLGWNPVQDSTLIAAIKELLAAGYGEQILLSHDAGWYQPGEQNGGSQMPYTYLIDTFIPKLRDNGIDDETIRMITEINPIRAFGFNQDVKP